MLLCKFTKKEPARGS